MKTLSLNQVQKKIAERYEAIHQKYNNCPHDDRLTTIMDLSLVETIFPNFRWEELLNTDDFNFIHDIFGIKRHINRREMTIEGCFLPRFSGGE